MLALMEATGSCFSTNHKKPIQFKASWLSRKQFPPIRIGCNPSNHSLRSGGVVGKRISPTVSASISLAD